jgi:hypothetical protein
LSSSLFSISPASYHAFLRRSKYSSQQLLPSTLPHLSNDFTICRLEDGEGFGGISFSIFMIYSEDGRKYLLRNLVLSIKLSAMSTSDLTLNLLFFAWGRVTKRF